MRRRRKKMRRRRRINLWRDLQIKTVTTFDEKTWDLTASYIA